MFDEAELAQLRASFFQEAREQLVVMEEGLLRLEFECGSAELINEIFRSAHTIKGSAGLFELDPIVAFTHQVEHVLDLVRQQRVVVSPELVAVLLQAKDHMQALVDTAAAGTELGLPHREHGRALQQSLQTLAHSVDAALPAMIPAAMAVTERAEAGGEVSSALWHISARFHGDVLRDGMDPASILHYLSSLGDIHNLRIVDDALPPLEELDAESCYLGLELTLESDEDKDTLASAFEFVAEGSEIWILPPRTRVSEYRHLIAQYRGDSRRMGEILVEIGALTAEELRACLAIQDSRLDEACAETAATPARLGEILVEQGAVAPELVHAVLDRQQRSVREEQTVRIASDKLDRLIDLVGELVIAGAGVAVKAGLAGDTATREAVDEMARLVEGIRDSALGLRMVEIGQTFNRFQRVVRDLGRQLGKPIELDIGGGEAELDKSVVEKLTDPLTHLVRNAIDHGIESPERRAAAGKPPTARVALHARHEAGSIVIEVSDDGAGLDARRILAKAIERGLVDADAELDEARIHELIFEPGFSTAEQVTDLSGRGVGMDVVRRNIQALRGTIDVETAAGRGTTFRIRLPLTLAIIDSLHVRAGEAGFVIPLDRVVECVEWGGQGRRGDCLDLRGALLPLISLRSLYSMDAPRAARENIVVVEYAGQRLGVVVDALCGEHQAVIKPLGPLFSSLQSISGTTVLGSGQIALILDVAGLFQTASAAAQSVSKKEVHHVA